MKQNKYYWKYNYSIKIVAIILLWVAFLFSLIQLIVYWRWKIVFCSSDNYFKEAFNNWSGLDKPMTFTFQFKEWVIPTMIMVVVKGLIGPFLSWKILRHNCDYDKFVISKKSLILILVALIVPLASGGKNSISFMSAKQYIDFYVPFFRGILKLNLLTKLDPMMIQFQRLFTAKFHTIFNILIAIKIIILALSFLRLGLYIFVFLTKPNRETFLQFEQRLLKSNH